MQKWPSYDENKIDKKAEAIAELLNNTRKDIIEIMRLANIEKPKKITLFIPEKWKYSFMQKLVTEMAKTRNQGDIMKAVMSNDLKKYGQEISRLVPKLLNDPAKIPQAVLSQEAEFDALKDAAADYVKEFGCKVDVASELGSKNPKSKQALPGKAAILVE